MKVSEMKEILERLHRIYPFEDDKTEIHLDRNPVKQGLIVAISTYDDKEDVTINLEADARSWRLDGENLYE